MYYRKLFVTFALKGFNSILFFSKILQLEKFGVADFKYDNIRFKFQAKDTQRKHFWSQILGILFYPEILQLDKFEGFDFKYDNVNFNFQPKNSKIKHFLAQI